MTESSLGLPALLESHVRSLAEGLGPRHLSVPKSFQQAADWIERQFQSAGYLPFRETYAVGADRVSNLIVDIPGQKRPRQLVMVGAHYDTVQGSPGADDNASAVAVLIEVARLLRQTVPQRSIRLVSFACEEEPYFHSCQMGSQVQARACREQGYTVTGMLSLEMVGFFSNQPGSQQLPPGLPRFIRPWIPTTGNFLAAVGNLRSWRLALRFRRGFRKGTRLPLVTLALPESIQEIRRSDNSSFWDVGDPALMITDTSFLRNPHYHQPSDLPETLNYEAMAEVTHGVASAVRYLAGG